ncbi:MAG: aldehyde dehydrogenase family protein, partial [Ilumatobacteraceae bacterium]
MGDIGNDAPQPSPVTVLNRIGAEQRPASDGAVLERRNPADTRRVVSIAPESTIEDVRAAVDAAVEAAAAWRRVTPSRRAELLTGAARLLTERGESIAAEMVAEEGKPLADAKNETGRTPRNLELYAGEAYRLTGATFPSDDTPLVYSTCDPVGVVGVITPWNFPIAIPSGSMEPTLLIGDALLASKYPYGYGTSSLPMQINLPETGRVFAGMPKRGDVVVFR